MKSAQKSIAIILILIFSIQLTGIEMVGAEENTYFSENFSGIPINGVPEKLTLKGSKNSRVIQGENGKKVLTLDLSEGIGVVTVPVEPENDTLWINARYCVTGNLEKADLFVLRDSAGAKTTLLSQSGGETKISFGKPFTGISSSGWNDVAVYIDYKAASYSVYVNGECKLADWKLESDISKTANIDFQFVASSGGAENYVEFDYIYVYGGAQMRTSFPSESYNEEVLDFEETSGRESGVKIYKQLDFENHALSGIQAYTFQDEGNAIETRTEADGNVYLHFQSLNGVGEYFNILLDNFESYFAIFELDYKPMTTEKYATKFLTPRDVAGHDSIDFRVTESSVRLAKGGSVPVQNDEWNHLAFAYDLIKHTVNVYYNNQLVQENIPLSREDLDFLTFSRIQTETGNPVFGIDNIYIYEAKQPLENIAELAEESLVSTFKSDEENMKNFIGSNTVFCVDSGAIYKDGEKVKGDVKGIIENDRTMIPVRAIAEAFDIPVSWDGENAQVTLNNNIVLTVGDNKIRRGNEIIESDTPVMEKNDRVYLPLRVLAEELLDKNVLWSDAGLVFLNDDEIMVSASDETNVEMVYRYLMYDRMSGAEFTERLSGAARPRLLVKKDRFALINQWIKTSERAKGWYDLVKTECDKRLDTNIPQFQLGAGGSISGIRPAKRATIDLCLMYRLTGEEKYAQRAWEEIESAINSPWSPAHFLSISTALVMCSVGYDWLYDWLDEEQRDFIAAGIAEKGLKEAKKAFSGQFGGFSFIRSKYNWTGVCNSGIIMACMALGDNPQYRDLCADVFESAQMAMEYLFRSFAPDGGWEESLGYYVYTTTYLQKALASLENTLGTSFGWTDSPGFANAVNWFIDTYGPCGVPNVGDSGTGYGTGGVANEGLEAFWWSDYFENPSITANELWKEDTFSLAGGSQNLLYMNPEYENAALDDVPRDARYRGIEYAVLRGNDWGENDAMWLAAYGGSSRGSHKHLDSGSFLFDALGERWAMDIGADNYDLPQWGAGHAKYYCVRAEGHNLFVINPGEGQDQLSESNSPITEFYSDGENGGYFVMDLSEAYSHQANSARRGFSMMDGRKSCVIRDEISLKNNNSEVYWFMHMLPDEIEVFDTYAVCHINGKSLRVDFLTNGENVSLHVMDAAPLSTSPQYEGTVDYSAVKKLALKVTGSKNLTITVKLTPIIEGEEQDFSVPDISLDEWGEQSGEV